jgi:hypothetical protein
VQRIHARQHQCGTHWMPPPHAQWSSASGWSWLWSYSFLTCGMRATWHRRIRTSA